MRLEHFRLQTKYYLLIKQTLEFFSNFKKSKTKMIARYNKSNIKNYFLNYKQIFYLHYSMMNFFFEAVKILLN